MAMICTSAIGTCQVTCVGNDQATDTSSYRVHELQTIVFKYMPKKKNARKLFVKALHLSTSSASSALMCIGKNMKMRTTIMSRTIPSGAP